MNSVLLVPARLGQGELLGRAVRKVLGELDPVVGRPRFFAEGDDLVGPRRVELDQLLDKALADHAVADDHDRLAPDHGETPSLRSRERLQTASGTATGSTTRSAALIRMTTR